jgi:peptidoglycan/LPS O-acetylase OafA/YrhL
VTWREIALDVIGYSTTMNGTLWSVQVELFMIPVLPALIWIAARTRLRTDIGILAVLYTVSARAMLHHAGYPTEVFAQASCFYAGIILPKLMESGARTLLAGGSLASAALVVGAFMGGPAGPVWGWTYSEQLAFQVFPSMALIAFVVSDPEGASFLNWRPLRRLGDISFSFYAYGQSLLQVFGLCAAVIFPHAHMFGAAVATGFAVVMTLAILLPLATLSYRWIELPGIALGRAILRRRDNAMGLSVHPLSHRAHWPDQSRQSAG